MKTQQTRMRFLKQKKIAIKFAGLYDTITNFERIDNVNIGEMHKADLLGLYGQVNKRIRWMPRQ